MGICRVKLPQQLVYLVHVIGHRLLHGLKLSSIVAVYAQDAKARCIAMASNNIHMVLSVVDP